MSIPATTSRLRRRASPRPSPVLSRSPRRPSCAPSPQFGSVGEDWRRRARWVCPQKAGQSNSHEQCRDRRPMSKPPGQACPDRQRGARICARSVHQVGPDTLDAANGGIGATQHLGRIDEAHKEDFVFRTTGVSAVSGLSRAKRRLDEKIKELKGEPLEHWTVHDLRHTATTGFENPSDVRRLSAMPFYGHTSTWDSCVPLLALPLVVGAGTVEHFRPSRRYIGSDVIPRIG
jgi:hypothetical protein